MEAQTQRLSQQNICLFEDPPTSASTRALALGNANTVGREDDVIFYNPARLAIARGTSIAGERYDVGVASGTFATVTRIGSGGVGIGAHAAAAREPYCGSNIFDTGPDTPVSLALGAVGLAQTFKRIQFGAAVKYVSELRSARQSRLVADVGVARDMSIGIVPISVGLAGLNLSNELDNPLLPWRVALGASAGGPIGPMDLLLVAQLAATRDEAALPAGGAEIGYQWLDGYSFSLRGGARRGVPFTNEGNFTGGAGLVLDRLSIDYAFETQSGGRPLAHRLGLRIR